MIYDLIREEIHMNFYKGGNRRATLEDSYIMHCSPSVLKYLVESFYKAGFIIVDTLQGVSKNLMEQRNVSFHIPNVGIITCHADLEQGYKIEKI